MGIVCLGDSITAGQGKEEGHWIELLNKEQNIYINKGICGDTTGGMLARFHRDVVSESGAGKSVLIMGGWNDYIVGADNGVVQANLMAMVHQAWYHQIFPIIGVAPLPNLKNLRGDWKAFTDFEEVLKCCIKQREWTYRFAEQFNTEVLDFETALTKLHHGERWELFSDGIHPNKEGNRLMAEWVTHVTKWHK